MKKEKIQIGILGLGTVGSGVVKVLTGNGKSIAQKTGVPVEVKKVLVRDKNKKRQLASMPILTDNPQDILKDPDIDIVVEVMGGENPAKEYLLQAMEAGKHVVTANKDIVAKHGKELLETAEKYGVDFMFEASVGGGIPIIRPLKQCMAANQISEIMGILNGTTNYMLSKMTMDGMDYGAVLAEAQAKGYAEADPTADVGGFDAARKIAILASIAFGARVTFDDVAVEGIESITAQDILYATELGYVIKMLATAKQTEKGIGVQVHPAFLPVGHPLAAVHDVFNSVYVKGDAIGEAMFYGRGAGEMPTASSVVADVIDIARNIQHGVNGRILCTCFEEKPISPTGDLESFYYVRLQVADQPGVLAAIAGAFGIQTVSLHSVIQKRKIGQDAEIVLITYKVADGRLRSAMKALSELSAVKKICNVIRVEGVQGE